MEHLKDRPQTPLDDEELDRRYRAQFLPPIYHPPEWLVEDMLSRNPDNPLIRMGNKVLALREQRKTSGSPIVELLHDAGA